MNIRDNAKKTTTFRDIKNGDVFRAWGYIYIRLVDNPPTDRFRWQTTHNAVKLDAGTRTNVNFDEPVELLSKRRNNHRHN